jgi:hypothetical protein
VLFFLLVSGLAITNSKYERLEIQIDELRRLFRFVPETGELFWKIPRQGVRRGKPAGSSTKQGYKKVCIGGKYFLQHRVVFAMVKGYWPIEVDHIDRCKSNNRIGNLREVTTGQNAWNMAALKAHTALVADGNRRSW